VKRRRCENCNRSFAITARHPEQKFCSRKECQKARKNNWQRRKLSSDEDYRKNTILHYILGVKKGDHPFLFKKVEEARKNDEAIQFDLVDKDDPQKTHRFLFLNQVPLNESNQDLLINFLEYWEITPEKTQHFSWVTDFTITNDNAYDLMRGGRARWKIENETFNTLKNQGYHFVQYSKRGKCVISSFWWVCRGSSIS